MCQSLNRYRRKSFGFSSLVPESFASFDSLREACPFFLPPLGRFFWLEYSIKRKFLSNFVYRAPDANFEPGCDRCTEASDLFFNLPLNPSIDQVRLSLHHQVVNSHATINSHRVDSLTSVLRHCLNYFCRSKTGWFKKGPHQMSPSCVKAHSN